MNEESLVHFSHPLTFFIDALLTSSPRKEYDFPLLYSLLVFVRGSEDAQNPVSDRIHVVAELAQEILKEKAQGLVRGDRAKKGSEVMCEKEREANEKRQSSHL